MWSVGTVELEGSQWLIQSVHRELLWSASVPQRSQRLVLCYDVFLFQLRLRQRSQRRRLVNLFTKCQDFCQLSSSKNHNIFSWVSVRCLQTKLSVVNEVLVSSNNRSVTDLSLTLRYRWQAEMPCTCHASMSCRPACISFKYRGRRLIRKRALPDAKSQSSQDNQSPLMCLAYCSEIWSKYAASQIPTKILNFRLVNDRCWNSCFLCAHWNAS